MIVLYFLLLLALGIYSYAQIDLNLTLLQLPLFLKFQHFMIQLGYFNRFASTIVFSFITLLLFAFYLYFWRHGERTSKKQLQILLVGLSILGLFSYPAFSHDIFNYIYSGRIVAIHHTNPYFVTPLDFPNDEWTRFMQWTHVPFAWGPVYLLLVLPFYYLGLGKFVLTLLSFKLMAVLAFLGSCYIIDKISTKKEVLLFALNPLVIYEGLVAAHVDIIMVFFALLAIYYWSVNQKVASFSSMVISVGIKYATVTLLPLYFWSKNWQKRAGLLTLLAYVGSVGQIVSRELLPHYLLVPFAITALFPNQRLAQRSMIILSLVLLLLRYLPFIATGQWDTIRLPLKPF